MHTLPEPSTATARDDFKKQAAIGGMLAFTGIAGLVTGFVLRDAKWRQHALLKDAPFPVKHPFLASLPIAAAWTAATSIHYRAALDRMRETLPEYWTLTPYALTSASFTASWMIAGWFMAQFSLVKPPYVLNLARFFLDGLVDGVTFGRLTATHRLKVLDVLNPELPETHQLNAQLAALKGDWNGCLRSYYQSMLACQSREARTPLPVLVKKLYRAVPGVKLYDESANVLARQYAAIREGNLDAACALAVTAAGQQPDDIDLALLEARVLSLNNRSYDARRIASTAVRKALQRTTARQHVAGGSRNHAIIPSEKHAESCIFIEADDDYKAVERKYRYGSFAHDSFPDKTRTPWPMVLEELDSGLEGKHCLISERINAASLAAQEITADIAGRCMALLAEYQQRCTRRLSTAGRYGIVMRAADFAAEYDTKIAARLGANLLDGKSAYMRIVAPLNAWRSFVHYDSHPGNFLCDERQEAIIDSELCHLSDHVIDSETFIAGSMNDDVRTAARERFYRELPRACRKNYSERSFAASLRAHCRIAGALAVRGNFGEAAVHAEIAGRSCFKTDALAYLLLSAAEQLSKQ